MEEQPNHSANQGLPNKFVNYGTSKVNMDEPIFSSSTSNPIRVCNNLQVTSSNGVENQPIMLDPNQIITVVFNTDSFEKCYIWVKLSQEAPDGLQVTYFNGINTDPTGQGENLITFEADFTIHSSITSVSLIHASGTHIGIILSNLSDSETLQVWFALKGIG
ncbi:hypothetical protein [Neobacillus jeddahensis]|uniref:hypothetical protein n=1 Tax=Neobacillus jeddahensis TaxID=1461580 RepID=UPI00058E90B0|nr:hypothetical protein [Neobacillus jeddahensis]